MGLFQFVVQEAQKALTVAKVQNDCMLIADAYLFIGINHFEMNQFSKAEVALYGAKRYFAKNSRKRLRFLVRNEHIYNNIARLKLAQNRLDSAVQVKAVHEKKASKTGAFSFI
ncbi:hypothetical protein [Flavobacterium selenitireducens]|uniref:hypothetical protein n=1 Tax=Flavobacterium selenitireducens TaxID=2722704 RepID=UPI00168BE413|nr:hypothetical protein [Flavobacterium selenitireducens]MBD3581832.1 hypothetical protein [Flavobacterium selenitireducens]